MNRFKLSMLFLFTLLFLIPATTHGQTVNSAAVPNGNFNSTTPSPDAGYFACLFKTSGLNIITECPISGNAMENLAFSLAPAINLATGNVIQFACTTASSSVVPTISGLTKGAEFTVIFVQNGTTACTWTWPSNIHGATAVSATLSSVSTQSFVVSNNGTDAYAQSAGTACTATCGTP